MSTMASIGSEESTVTKFGRGTLSVLRRGRILIAAIDRPNVRNAFNDDVYLDLIDLMHDVTDDSSISAIVLTGKGTYFSSGADLKSTAFEPSKYENASMVDRPPAKLVMSLLAFPKIIVAAVNGPTVGIACTILMHCDLVICSDRATFWAPFTRLALVPEACSSVTLPEVMGLSKANEMLLLGKKIDAKTAVEWNICSRVLSSKEFDDVNPFAKNSLANNICRELDKRILSLPRGDVTAEVFVSLIRGSGSSRRNRLQQVCRDEFNRLDQRFRSGEVKYAAKQLAIGRKRKTPRRSTPRSKL